MKSNLFEPARLRAWWAKRQLLFGQSDLTPADCLSQIGWARSVGGVNPYVTLFSRIGTSREELDGLVYHQTIMELPSARGCTYILPARDFELGLKVGEPFSIAGGEATARKFLGLTDEELDALCTATLKSLESGPKSPTTLKLELGDLVRNLGEEGKKRGQTTLLPSALAKLQREGKIHRVPQNGRLDTQNYEYKLWGHPVGVELEEAQLQLAQRYFSWIGPATAKDFQWFSGLGVAAVKKVLAQLELIELGEGFLILPEDLPQFESFEMPTEPDIRLIAGLDSLFLLRRDFLTFLDPADQARQVLSDKKILPLKGLQDLPTNAVVDRGRIIGLWEYDFDRQSVVAALFVPRTDLIQDQIVKTETFIRDQLGDARSFSLDSPKSRQPYIDALRAMSDDS